MFSSMRTTYTATAVNQLEVGAVYIAAAITATATYVAAVTTATATATYIAAALPRQPLLTPDHSSCGRMNATLPLRLLPLLLPPLLPLRLLPPLLPPLLPLLLPLRLLCNKRDILMIE